jgi:nitroreductase
LEIQGWLENRIMEVLGKMRSYIFNTAKKRKTVRRFAKNSLDLNLIHVALKAACQAPSGANWQPWRFMIITSSSIKKKVRKVCEQGEKRFYVHVKGTLKNWLLKNKFDWTKPFLEDAPVLLLVLSETQAPYSIQSVWIAIGYILLVLEELGLSTVTYTPSNTKALQDTMGIPEDYKIEVILPLGVSRDNKKKEPRRSVTEVTYLNNWDHKVLFT